MSLYSTRIDPRTLPHLQAIVDKNPETLGKLANIHNTGDINVLLVELLEEAVKVV